MGEWIEVKFGDFAKGVRGVSYKQSDLIDIYNYNDETFILLRANNIQNNSIVFDDIQIVPGSIVNKKQKAVVGDIAVCMSNGSKRLVGKTASIPECSENLTVGAFCALFKPNDSFDKGFVKYQFQSQNYQRRIDIALSGSTINNLRINQIESFKAYIPKEKLEQSKIAEILTTIDDAIEKTEKIIAKYRRIKQGLMHDLLTGKVRVTHLLDKGGESGECHP